MVYILQILTWITAKQILKDGRHDILFWTLSKGIPTRDEFTVCVGRSVL